MRARIVLLIACGIICLIVIVGAAYTKRQTHPPQVTSSSPNNLLQERVARARAKGQRKVSISAPDIEYTGSSGSTNLDKALSYYTAVVASPIKMQSYIAQDGEDIVTWYRFRVVDILSENTTPACPACPVPTPPEEFSQVKKDEFVLVKTGGTVTVDGINVTMTDPSFPEFESGKKYLLFISKYPSGVAILGIGPKGIFTVDDLGDIKGINQVPHAVKDDIDGRLNHSLFNLQQHARSLKDK